MSRVVIVGCGVVGAMVAYELSRHRPLTVTVMDGQLPGHGATGAALGILMGVISQKAKGRNWRLREASLRRYHTLLPELAALGLPVPHNGQGILSLCFDEAALPRWRSLQAIRDRQGWPLEIWSPDQVAAACPHLALTGVVAGIYSPQDLQVAPKALTQALVTAATRQGVQTRFQEAVTGFDCQGDRVQAVHTDRGTYPADRVVLTAGLGTLPLTTQLGQPLPLGPVLGQGVRVRLAAPLGDRQFQPVINGDDVHLVPLGQGDYGVAATVEFPPEDGGTGQPDPAALDQVWQRAIAYCPGLAAATVVDTWHGRRPRPQGQAAPVIEPLAGYGNVMLATGHYRNGVFLAPATAAIVADWVLSNRD
ncbi:MAG: FAD-dependent oxidoreductase [Leptolyngbya sp.]|nr:FAD-dependent oxidoreductase [Leptolyngbya sp.]